VRTSVRINFFRFAALLFFLGGFGYYFSLQKEMWTVLGEVNSEYVFIMAVIDSLFYLSNAMILKILLKSFEVSLSVKECLSISSLAGVGNLLTSLSGGTIGKAVYLKRKYTFPYMTFIAATSAVALINLNLAAFMGVIAILMIGYSSHSLLAVFLCFFVAVNLLFGFLLFSPGKVETCRWKIFGRLSGIAKGLDLIRRDRKLVSKISFLLVFNFFLSIAGLALSYGAFSIDISLVEVILIDALSIFSGIIKILPGNLGVYEGSIALSSQILGVGFREGLLAAGLVRVVSIFVMLIFGLIFGLRILVGKPNEEPVRQ
jgi:uncharacterized membrane protein YbhN (UPF0104 family)